MMDKAFILSHNNEHSGDSERDAFLLGKEDSVQLPHYFLDCSTYPTSILPKQLYFEANFNLIPEYDYPYTDLRIPILSKKMLSVLIDISDSRSSRCSAGHLEALIIGICNPVK